VKVGEDSETTLMTTIQNKEDKAKPIDHSVYVQNYTQYDDGDSLKQI
jgi:hypothetical protein